MKVMLDEAKARDRALGTDWRQGEGRSTVACKDGQPLRYRRSYSLLIPQTSRHNHFNHNQISIVLAITYPVRTEMPKKTQHDVTPHKIKHHVIITIRHRHWTVRVTCCNVQSNARTMLDASD
jgi:hypothetical protein